MISPSASSCSDHLMAVLFKGHPLGLYRYVPVDGCEPQTADVSCRIIPILTSDHLAPGDTSLRVTLGHWCDDAIQKGGRFLALCPSLPRCLRELVEWPWCLFSRKGSTLT
ncbi:unnamed protein product [Durusdinium trenchii]|uniref:Uncharacterized protein n=1 Tax=Durusdinium trenchii TaxID=1381693 RepID=A0ABP0LHP6_9DINO